MSGQEAQFSPAQQKSQKSRKLLEEGARLIYEKGYNATGVKDIVDAAGVPKGSFYTYFPSKEDFTVQAIKYYSGLQQGGPLEDKSLAPLERIRKFFDGIIKYLETVELKQGCMVGNMCQEMADHNEAIRKTVEAMFVDQEKKMMKCLQEAREQGQLSGDPEKLAAFIQNSWQGHLLRMKSSRNIQVFENFQTVLFEKVLI